MRTQVMLGGMLGVLCCVQLVGVSQVCMVRCCLVVALQVMLGRFMVMVCGMLVMLRCLSMMMGCLAGHGGLLSRYF